MPFKEVDLKRGRPLLPVKPGVQDFCSDLQSGWIKSILGDKTQSSL